MTLDYAKLFSVVVLGVLLAGMGQLAAQLLPSDGAPKVGEKAPAFTLPDSEGNPVSLASLLDEGAEGETALGHAQYLLLVFYRGYW